LELLEQLEPFEQETTLMPSDETRRVLKMFGVAVTTYEDAVEAGASTDEIDKAEAEFRSTLSEITALIERLRAKRNARTE
jgi:hypothetical protein